MLGTGIAGYEAYMKTREQLLWLLPSLEYLKQMPVEEVLSKEIWELNFSTRARKAMIRAGIKTIGELVQEFADFFLRKIQNCGLGTLSEIRVKLDFIGLKLKGD